MYKIFDSDGLLMYKEQINIILHQNSQQTTAIVFTQWLHNSQNQYSIWQQIIFSMSDLCQIMGITTTTKLLALEQVASELNAIKRRLQACKQIEQKQQ